MIYDLADEQKGRQGSGEATDDPITKSSGAGGSGKIAMQHQPLDTLSVHDLAALRKIIAEVIDGGIHGDNDAPWGTYDGFGGCTTSGQGLAPQRDAVDQRELFTEAVIDRVIATAAPSIERGDHQ